MQARAGAASWYWTAFYVVMLTACAFVMMSEPIK
jgi:hypothetical protein